MLRDITRPQMAEGGGTGMVSTAGDYARFLQMLLNGGTLEGVRVLSRKTVEQMTTNQLDPSIKAEGPGYYPGPGYGYGLGFAVRRTEGLAGELGSVGDYHIEGRLECLCVRRSQRGPRRRAHGPSGQMAGLPAND